MNRKEKREVIGVGFWFAGLVIAIGNLWAILVTDQIAPFPPISLVLITIGHIFVYWRNK